MLIWTSCKAALSSQPATGLGEYLLGSPTPQCKEWALLLSAQPKQIVPDFVVSVCPLAPSYPAQVFPRAECEMPAVSCFPFIPRIAVTLASQSHAIRCLQAAHVPMQVPAGGA